MVQLEKRQSLNFKLPASTFPESLLPKLTDLLLSLPITIQFCSNDKRELGGCQPAEKEKGPRLSELNPSADINANERKYPPFKLNRNTIPLK
ncbi:hypothetical protein [Secundilactobacillus collinoides]|uniref:Uncharacterized protein n=1 Tax=Secundilactobacillus collinoides TaxID=33960 RepID=A0A166GXL8_SECCO|nr:hypothetical protein [Secundilactobacillus collinoides]KZL41011.1 hypothetical protein TY91_07090 [Secundilactobacillus collinoides]